MLKKIMLKILREVIGRLIVLISFLTSPKPIKRSPEQQEIANNIAVRMSVYQYFTCPFCIKTRRTIRRLNIPIEYRDAQNRDSNHRATLENEGGKVQVPCLRIDENGKSHWIYESSEIIAYLNRRFDPTHHEQKA